jgi:hypothetical protein
LPEGEVGWIDRLKANVSRDRYRQRESDSWVVTLLSRDLELG